MLLSHQYRFIFIKTKKTAGTSLEMALSPFLTGEWDIITPISPEDEAARLQLGIGPKNHSSVIPGIGPNRQFWNHISAEEIKARVPPKLWENFSKVTVERHPYEKAVSLAYYRFHTKEFPDFAACMEDTLERGGYKNIDRYSIDGTIIADRILRHEHLLADTNAFLKSFGLAPLAQLPRAKSTYRDDQRPAHEILTFAQKQKIQEVCAAEFEYFGYVK